VRAILIDDEEGARGQLRELLTTHPVEIVAEADHPLEAIEMVNRLEPDLIFLDIQMPLMDGFDILPYLRTRPIVVFCSAHDVYALEAFEVNALDYLLKPVSAERLAMALDRARNEWQKLEALAEMAPRPRGLRNIVCQTAGKHHVIWLREIWSFAKEGRYTAVETEQGRFLTDLTLDYLETKIVHPDFFRINRGVILRKDRVRGFEAKPHGSAAVTTIGGEVLTVSRSRFGAFKKWFVISRHEGSR